MTLMESVMSDVHKDLAVTLQADVSQDAGAHAPEAIEHQKPAFTDHVREERPGPYAPNSWSMYGGRLI